MKAFGIVVGVAAAVLCVLSANDASARNDKKMFPIQDAMTTPDAQQKLNQNIKFYFGDQPHPKIARSFGEFQSNKKTNAFNKSDKGACEWAFLSAMLSFQERALSEGGNAVVNIKSYYHKNLISDRDQYECGAGNLMAGVTFKGTVVKLAP